MKRCHKIGFVPHSRNFHIKLPLSHKQNEFYKQCDSLTVIFICEQLGMVQLLEYLAQQWPTEFSKRTFSPNWPVANAVSILHRMDLIFLHGIRVVSFIYLYMCVLFQPTLELTRFEASEEKKSTCTFGNLWCQSKFYSAYFI